MKIGCVIPTRNDGYGSLPNGTLEDRATYCINSAIATYDIIYLIDWNSELGKGPLLWKIKDNIDFKGNLKHIIIQPEAARILTNNDPDAQVCNEVLSRNLGIRRIMHEVDWIMSSNIDVIAPRRDQLEDLVTNQLNQNTFYTISRRPIDWEVIDKWYNNNNITSRLFKAWPSLRDYLISQSQERHYIESVNNSDKYSLINCCGDAQLAHSSIWKTIKGFEEELIYVLYSDTNVQKKAVMHNFELKALYNPALFHINHGRGGGGFLDGVNKKVNDMNRAITFQHHTQNKDTWGFSNIEIEYEVL